MDQQQLPEKSLACPSWPARRTRRGAGHPLPPATCSREVDPGYMLYLKGCCGCPGMRMPFLKSLHPDTNPLLKLQRIWACRAKQAHGNPDGFPRFSWSAGFRSACEAWDCARRLFASMVPCPLPNKGPSAERWTWP